MKKTLLLILAASSCAFAQTQGGPPPNEPNVLFYRSTQGPGGPAVAVKINSAPVVGAPYSATIETETDQALADGNHIVMKNTGEIARDSQGRTRQQMELPAIGNLAAANAPQIVFILDPVAQVSYTLNLTDKTAMKIPPPPPVPPGAAIPDGGQTAVAIGGGANNGPLVTTGGPMPPPLPPGPGKGMVFIQRTVGGGEPGQTSTEDLGTQTMQGLTVIGRRTTTTIPAGQIGNELPIKIVTEVWTSPDLKAIVYSKRTDPRMGEQTFQLTNISRNDPDPSLFTVPADFKIIDGPQPIVYAPKQ